MTLGTGSPSNRFGFLTSVVCMRNIRLLRGREAGSGCGKGQSERMTMENKTNPHPFSLLMRGSESGLPVIHLVDLLNLLDCSKALGLLRQLIHQRIDQIFLHFQPFLYTPGERARRLL